MIRIEFDRPRSLHYDLAAIRDLEKALDGKPLGVIVNDLANMGVNSFVFALWAGLKHEDRGLTPNLVTKRLEAYLKDAGEPGSDKKLSLLADAINDALEESGLFRAAADENPPRERPAATN
jgi:hypothetical protein